MKRTIPLQTVLDAIDAEPEYPGEAPTEMKEVLQMALETKDFDLYVETMRITVRLTKQGIRERIEKLAE